MQAIKTLSEIEDEIEHLVIGLVYASPKEVVYEVEEQFLSQVLNALEEHDPIGIKKNNRWFVSVAL
jgi:hypothetical protein